VDASQSESFLLHASWLQLLGAKITEMTENAERCFLLPDEMYFHFCVQVFSDRQLSHTNWHKCMKRKYNYLKLVFKYHSDTSTRTNYCGIGLQTFGRQNIWAIDVTVWAT